MKKILFVAAIMVLGLTSANAQYGPRDDRYRYDNRDYNTNRGYGDGRHSEISSMQREARDRISDGVRSRRLSRREAGILMREYDRIEALERGFTRRGRLSSREARILREDLRRLMAETHRMGRRDGDWARDNRY